MTACPHTGQRNPTYRKAVRAQLGPLQEKLCAIVQYTQLFTSGVGWAQQAGIKPTSPLLKTSIHPFNSGLPERLYVYPELCLVFSPGYSLYRYTVTGSLSLVAAKRAVCFGGYLDKGTAPCSFSNIPWMVFFGALNTM